MNSHSKLDWKGVLGGVTTFFSVVFLVVSPNWFLSIAGSAYVSLLLFVGALICFRLKQKEWAKSALYLLIPMLVTSFLCTGKSLLTEKRINNRELIADATESIVEGYLQGNMEGWIQDAMDSGDLVCFLLPTASWTDDNSFIASVNDIEKYRASAEELTSFIYQTQLSHFSNKFGSKGGNKEIMAKYIIGFSNNRYLKDGWEKQYDVKLLPESAMMVVNGVRNIQNGDWKTSKELFSKADSLGNAAGTARLALWYSVGYGQEPDSTEYSSYLEKAAINGSRFARLEWAEKKLKGKSLSVVEKAKAEDYLKRASSLKTVVTLATIDYSERSIKLLNKYYVSTGQNLKAYYYTKRYLNKFDNPYIRYSEHLANCLNLRLYRKAKKIIKEGEKVYHPNCFYIHGRMYAEGVAERKNVEKAEELFKYAADSLHYKKAYLGLARLYERTGRDGADFWRMMYYVDFTDKIK